MILLSVSRSEAMLLADGLRSMEYWDSPPNWTCRAGTDRSISPKMMTRGGERLPRGSDEEHAMGRKIRILRVLATRVESRIVRDRPQPTSSCRP